MKYFLATNAKQLDLCLKMLFAESIEPTVKTLRNGKGKIFYRVGASIDEATFNKLNERYSIMIS